MIKIYEYKNCSTCQKALQFLASKNIEFTRVPIVEQPPTKAELTRMLSYLQQEGGTFKNLFNTSGQQYRELEISKKLKEGLSESEALDLLSQNGKLIKRPFLLTASSGTVGFKEEIWKRVLAL